jgi:hypothetical protein
MRRATIVATMVIAFSSHSLAASDAEIAKSGEKMSAAFKCLTYASMFHDHKEEDRLFLIGLKAGRDFVEGMKSFSDGLNEMVAFIRKTSTDFVVGVTYDSETTKAYDQIVKYDDGLPREHRLRPDEAKTQAERSYRDGNCSLIQ